MKTLYDFGIELSNIRTALNAIEVRGQQNASLLVYACDKCNELIKELNEIGRSLSETENKEQAEGDMNAE